MTRTVKAILAFSVLVAALGLSACGPTAGSEKEAPAAPAVKPDLLCDAGPADWDRLAAQRDGGLILVSRSSLVRGERPTILTRAVYKKPQIWAGDDTIRYTIETIEYRFDCGAGAFTIANRRLVRPDGCRGEPLSYPDAYKPAAAGGVAALLLPIACGPAPGP